MATGKAWFRVPSAIKFNLTGSLPKYVSGKDVILHIIGKIGVDGALYRSMEFAGDGVASLTMDDRFTICNMAIEAGAKNGIFPVDELGKIEIQQSVIGSCTNGRIQDMRDAAAILKGRKVKSNVRTIVIPATQEIYLQCIEEGLAKIFVEAGAIVSTPTCGPCLGGHMGILAHDEKAISTTNRNFVGRMGHVSSEIYLANPAVAAASAVTGYITDPAELD